MFHTIEFRADFTTDLETSPQHRLEHLRVLKGTRVVAALRPYVVETTLGPIEVADLYFEDGTITRAVGFAQFRFAD
jgi:hypothetical protein